MKHILIAAVAASGFFASAAYADTISPTSVTDSLAIGESLTVRKTVVVEATGPTDAIVDAFFLIDTSGSMGAEIDAAKAATSDIISALDSFGNSTAGVGVFAEAALPGTGDNSSSSTSFNLDLTSNNAAITTAVNNVTLGDPDFGGSFPESSNTAIDIAANSASWRPGSNRFIFVLGDASSNEFVSDADVMASLAANDIDLIGINFGGSAFADDITDLGGTVFDGSATAASIVAAVTAGITAGFAEYDEVTVDDLGGGLPEIGVSTVCVSADSGACVGADAIGSYDRSVDRTFEFDVTFTRLAAGDKAFETYALVDGGIVAVEKDRFTDSAVVPLPAAGWLLLGGLGVLAGIGRRRAA